jgi:hypothetical protein
LVLRCGGWNSGGLCFGSRETLLFFLCSFNNFIELVHMAAIVWSCIWRKKNTLYVIGSMVSEEYGVFGVGKVFFRKWKSG